jgi:hypothetical protein
VATYAPERPTTTELHEKYPLSDFTVERIEQRRLNAGAILTHEIDGLVALFGGCSIPNHIPQEVHTEGRQIAAFEEEEEGIQAENRLCVWKPRSDPNDWHGVETKRPEAAHQAVTMRAVESGHVAMEFAHPRHAERYGSLTTVAWGGSRNVGNVDTLLEIARRIPYVPFPIKNGLDGNIDHALMVVDKINGERGDGGAPSVLLYRGGMNAQTPDTWREQCAQAIKATEGRIIIDVAHGGEMAHDPLGRFGKSELGQIACMMSLAQVMREGYIPAGVMVEASDVPSETDPTIPLALAMDGIRTLNAIRKGL